MMARTFLPWLGALSAALALCLGSAPARAQADRAQPDHAPSGRTQPDPAQPDRARSDPIPPDHARTDQPDYSRAERLLFMTDQIGRLQPPVTLRYTFRRSGTLEAPFEDSVAIMLTRQADGACCQARGEFLSGARRVALPDIEHAEANPVVLYFLEHDVRDMLRLTRGSPAYYRKRIRMAVYQAARVTDVTLSYRGQAVGGQRIAIAPYRDDPARGRFEKFARKTYEFYLSDAVPGGVHGIRTVMRAQEAGAPAMMVEELALEGAELPPIGPGADEANP